jgi:hypothetical protein
MSGEPLGSLAGILQHGAQPVGSIVAGLKQSGYLRPKGHSHRLPVPRSTRDGRRVALIGFFRFRLRPSPPALPSSADAIITTGRAI